jgi:hypothetical protein
LTIPKEAPNKSILDFSASVTGKHGFPLTLKITGLQPPILAVHPCTAGAAE